MIELTDWRGSKVYVAANAVATIEPVPPSHHAIQAEVRTTDGRVLEVREAPSVVATKVEAASR